MLRHIIFTVLLTLTGIPCAAGEWRILELESAGMEIFEVGMFRDSYFPQTEHGDYNKGVAALFDVEVINGVCWDNKVMTLGNDSQVRTVSWEWDLAIRPHEKFELFYYHHSQHVLDETPPIRGEEYDNFPLRDLFGVRMIFFERSSPRRSWW